MAPGWVAALVLLTTLALAVRLRGIDYLLPHEPDSDGHIVPQALLMRSGDPHPEENPNWAKYPHLVARIASLLPLESAETPKTLADHLRAAAHPFVVVRIVVACLAVLIVPATFLLARSFLPCGGSLFAAALAATSLLHMNFSQQARPHGAAASVIALSVVAAVRMRRRPVPSGYALAGLASALALGSLQFGVSALAPLVTAHVLRDRNEARRVPAGIALAIALLALSIPVFHDYALSGPTEGRDTVFDTLDDGGVKSAGHVIHLRSFDGRGFLTILQTLWSYEPVLLVLGAIGLAASIAPKRRPARSERPSRDRWVILSHALPYLVVVGLYRTTFERFLLPLLPYAAILSAIGARAAARAIEGPLARGCATQSLRWVALVVAAVSLALPCTLVWRLGSLRSQVDTQEEAARWIAATPELREAAIVCPIDLDFPLFRTDPRAGFKRYFLKGTDEHFAWVRYQKTLPEEARAGAVELSAVSAEPNAKSFFDRFAETAADYVVIQVNAGTTHQGPASPLRVALLERAERVATFSPYRDGSTHDRAFSYLPIGLRSGGLAAEVTMVRRVLDARTVGPILEVYRLAAPER